MSTRIREIQIPILVLVEIKRRNGARAKELEESLRISTSTLYSNIKNLLLLGYIEKRDGKYILTAKGMEYLNNLKAVYREIVESI